MALESFAQPVIGIFHKFGISADYVQVSFIGWKMRLGRAISVVKIRRGRRMYPRRYLEYLVYKQPPTLQEPAGYKWLKTVQKNYHTEPDFNRNALWSANQTTHPYR